MLLLHCLSLLVLGFTEEWFLLFWLAILFTITVLGFTKGWFILFLLYCLPLLFKV